MIKYPNIASEFVSLVHYCRWNESKGRRENWEEVTERVINWLKSKEHLSKVPTKVWKKIEDGLLNFSVMPSMRLVATAGPAADSNNICLYNCSYLPIDTLESFSELMYILMHGSGVGYSVEKENVNKLPEIKHCTGIMRDEYTVEDSREGWMKAILFGLQTWYAGEDVEYNFGKVRPKGAPLKTMGGTASGPEPLKKLLEDVKKIILNAVGRKLKTIECHDICCMIASCVVMGSKRRSACISFSDFDDDEMRDAKHIPFPSYRYMSNNSAVYKDKPQSAKFMKEWAELAMSGTGERGIYIEQERNGHKLRTNPCGEILLRPNEFCNLSEAVIRPGDDIDDLVEKVKTATWLGCIQATFTNFPNLRPIWKQNCEEERLIGVSLTGQMDNSEILTEEVLKQLRKTVEKVAKHACKILGINFSAALTAVKPSGTVSQLVNSSSGCHARYAPHYIRRYRINTSDPMFHMMCDQGMEWFPEVGQTKDNCSTAVFEFPIRAVADNMIYRSQMNAIDQLNWYLKLQDNWCSHNTSITIYVPDSEWLKVGSEVYDKWGRINGVAFFPLDEHNYPLAPYEEITSERYLEMLENFPRLDFTKLGEYEKISGDTTKTSREFSCSGDRCELK